MQEIDIEQVAANDSFDINSIKDLQNKLSSVI